ncbi:LysR family transcriptional regulator [Thalassotalea atypica]|uniref:LysR family transcriptional regulator n=1 Tax=Thalassotalea atypica TaxID=2054316 RepID=UPI0025731F77|nr:LysR family transcriptional regulator [Thalassotalea atypica]
MFDKITAFIVFRAIVRNGSLTSAAKELNMSKASVSRYLRYLESWLKSKLLLRTTRSLTLTQTGEQLYDQCQEVLEKMEFIEDKLPKLEKSLMGRLKVSLPREVKHLIFSHLPDFQQQHPDLHILFDFSDRYVDLYNEPFDVAIRVGTLQPSSLFARKLSQFNDALVAAPSYLAENKTLTTPQDLVDHRCILDIHRTPPDSWTLIGPEREKFDIHVKGLYTVTDTEAVLTLARQGAGIANIPEYIAIEACTDGRLVRVLPAYKGQQYDIHVLFAERQFMPEKTRAFVNFLVTVFNK